MYLAQTCDASPSRYLLLFTALKLRNNLSYERPPESNECCRTVRSRCRCASQRVAIIHRLHILHLGFIYLLSSAFPSMTQPREFPRLFFHSIAVCKSSNVIHQVPYRDAVSSTRTICCDL